MKLFKKTDYFSVIKYLILFAVFLVFHKLEKQVYPYSVAILITAMTLGNLFFTPLVFLSSYLVIGEPGLLAAAALPCVFFAAVLSIYRKTRVKPKAELLAYAALSMLLYVFLGNTAYETDTEKRILVSIFTVVLTFVSLIAGNAITNKGLKYKLGREELAALALMTSLFGLGISNLVSPYMWKTLSVFIILCAAFVYRTGASLLFSATLGISAALFYGNISYVAVYIVLAVAVESLISFSRYAAAVAVVSADYLIQAVFGIYGGYTLNDFIFTLIGATCFCIIPLKLLKSLKEKLYAFREKQLARQSINRSRLMTSNRLYELAGVFNEMANSFSAFKKKGMSEHKAKETIRKEILSAVCANCENAPACKARKAPSDADLEKLTDIGFAKGKLSLIDFPRDLGNTCVKPNNLLFAMNKMLADYRAFMLENINVENGRALIAEEAQGVSEILRGLALETGALLKYQSRLERSLGDALFKNGFLVSEILIYGEAENVTVSIIITMKEFSIFHLQNVISKTLGTDMTVCEKADISEYKRYMSFKHAADYDAAIGVASFTKDGSDKCGDTHSVVRLKDDKFLVALSDGMGSGKQAENISDASLSLIESFYKAGLPNELILNTVNKLLAINTDDSFTALDVSVIDLKTCSADFIKYGSPYGFIIGDEGVKIIEGNTLPLGILEELKPAVCTTPLCDGDMLLFVSDGVSDAFGSSGEILDFLRTVPAKNPQTLADEIVNAAVNMNGGEKKDDMTALAVRVYRKKTSA